MSGSASCTWMCSSCQLADRRSGRCAGLLLGSRRRRNGREHPGGARSLAPLAGPEPRLAAAGYAEDDQERAAASRDDCPGHGAANREPAAGCAERAAEAEPEHVVGARPLRRGRALLFEHGAGRVVDGVRGALEHAEGPSSARAAQATAIAPIARWCIRDRPRCLTVKRRCAPSHADPGGADRRSPSEITAPLRGRPWCARAGGLRGPRGGRRPRRSRRRP